MKFAEGFEVSLKFHTLFCRDYFNLRHEGVTCARRGVMLVYDLYFGHVRIVVFGTLFGLLQLGPTVEKVATTQFLRRYNFMIIP